MLQRIREAFSDVTSSFGGPVEVDETYVGGKRKNMSTAKRKELEDVSWGPVCDDSRSRDEGPGDKASGSAGHRADGRGSTTGSRPSTL